MSHVQCTFIVIDTEISAACYKFLLYAVRTEILYFYCFDEFSFLVFKKTRVSENQRNLDVLRCFTVILIFKLLVCLLHSRHIENTIMFFQWESLFPESGPAVRYIILKICNDWQCFYKNSNIHRCVYCYCLRLRNIVLFTISPHAPFFLSKRCCLVPMGIDTLNTDVTNAPKKYF